MLCWLSEMSSHWGQTNATDTDTDKKAQDDFLVTSSSGNHGLACSDAMKRYCYHLNALWTPTPSCQPNRYGLKGSIIVPSNVSLAKRKKLELVGANLILHGTDCVQTELHGRYSLIIHSKFKQTAKQPKKIQTWSSNQTELHGRYSLSPDDSFKV